MKQMTVLCCLVIACGDATPASQDLGPAAHDAGRPDTIQPPDTTLSEDMSDPDTIQPTDTTPSTDVFEVPDTVPVPDTIPAPDTIPLPDTIPTPDTVPPDIGCSHPHVTPNCAGGWCEIPPGCFRMAVYKKAPCGSRETREVRLGRGFLMAQSETILEEFEKVVGYNPTTISPHKGPVERVTWNMAAFYCNELSKQEGRQTCYTCKSMWSCEPAVNPYDCPGYRLPTEAEWEYAYRAGTNTPLYNGKLSDCTSDPKADDIAWYKSTAGVGHHRGCLKTPNGWGLCDMAGNVAEMCHDAYSPQAGDGVVEDPVGSNGVGVRGGSFTSIAAAVTAHARRITARTDSSLYTGFRCVRSL